MTSGQRSQTLSCLRSLNVCFNIIRLFLLTGGENVGGDCPAIRGVLGASVDQQSPSISWTDRPTELRSAETPQTSALSHELPQLVFEPYRLWLYECSF